MHSFVVLARLRGHLQFTTTTSFASHGWNYLIYKKAMYSKTYSEDQIVQNDWGLSNISSWSKSKGMISMIVFNCFLIQALQRVSRESENTGRDEFNKVPARSVWNVDERGWDPAQQSLLRSHNYWDGSNLASPLPPPPTLLHNYWYGSNLATPLPPPHKLEQLLRWF